MEGVLEKKSKGFGLWQKRYFRLTRKALTYAKKLEDQSATELRLDGKIQVATSKDPRVVHVTIDREYRLRASNEMERDMWIAMLEPFTKDAVHIPSMLLSATLAAISHLRLHAVDIPQLFTHKGDLHRVAKVKMALLRAAHDIGSPNGSGKSIRVPKGSNPHDVASALIALLIAVPGGGILTKNLRKSIMRSQDKVTLRNCIKELPQRNANVVEALSKLLADLNESSRAQATTETMNYCVAALAQCSESKRKSGHVNKLTTLLSTSSNFVFSQPRDGLFGANESFDHEQKEDANVDDICPVDEDLTGVGGDDDDDGFLRRKREQREARMQSQEKVREEKGSGRLRTNGTEQSSANESQRAIKEGDTITSNSIDKVDQTTETTTNRDTLRPAHHDDDTSKDDANSGENVKDAYAERKQNVSKEKEMASEFGFSSLDLSNEFDGDDFDLLSDDEKPKKNKVGGAMAQGGDSKDGRVPKSGQGISTGSDDIEESDANSATAGSDENRATGSIKNGKFFFPEHKEAAQSGSSEAQKECIKLRSEEVRTRQTKSGKEKLTSSNAPGAESNSESTIREQAGDGKVKDGSSTGPKIDQVELEGHHDEGQNKDKRKSGLLKTNHRPKIEVGNADEEAESEDFGLELSLDGLEEGSELDLLSPEGSPIDKRKMFEALPEQVVEKGARSSTESSNAPRDDLTGLNCEMQIIPEHKDSIEETSIEKNIENSQKLSTAARGNSDRSQNETIGEGMDAHVKNEITNNAPPDSSAEIAISDGKVEDKGEVNAESKMEHEKENERKVLNLVERKDSRDRSHEDNANDQKVVEIKKIASRGSARGGLLDSTGEEDESNSDDKSGHGVTSEATTTNQRSDAGRSTDSGDGGTAERWRAEALSAQEEKEKLLKQIRNVKKIKEKETSDAERKVRELEAKLKMEQEDCRRNIESAVTRADVAEKELSLLREEVDRESRELEREKKERDHDHKTLQSSLEQSQRDLKETETKLEEAKRKLDTYEQKLEASLRNNTEVEREKADVEARVAHAEVIAVERERDATRQKLIHLEEENLKLKKIADAAQEEVHGMKRLDMERKQSETELEASLKKMHLDNNRLQRLVSELENTNQGLEKDISKNEIEIKELCSCIEKMGREKDLHAEISESIEKEKTSMQGHIEELKDKLSTQLIEINRLREHNNTLQSEIGSLTKENEVIQQHVSQASAASKFNQDSLIEERSRNQEMRSKVDALEAELIQVKREAESAQCELKVRAVNASDGEKGEIEMKVSQLAELKVLLDTMKMERDRAQKLADQRQQQIQILSHKVLESQKTASQASERLATEIKRARALEQTVDVQVTEHKDDFEELRQKHETLSARYDVLRSEHMKASQELADELRKSERLSVEMRARSEHERKHIEKAELNTLQQSAETEKLKLRLEVAQRTIAELKDEIKVMIASNSISNTNKGQEQNLVARDNHAREAIKFQFKHVPSNLEKPPATHGSNVIINSPVWSVRMRQVNVQLDSPGHLGEAQRRMEQLGAAAKIRLREARERLDALKARMDGMIISEW